MLSCNPVYPGNPFRLSKYLRSGNKEPLRLYHLRFAKNGPFVGWSDVGLHPIDVCKVHERLRPGGRPAQPASRWLASTIQYAKVNKCSVILSDTLFVERQLVSKGVDL